MEDNVKCMELDGMTITLVRVSLDVLPIESDQFHKDCKHNIFEDCAAFRKSTDMLNNMARTVAVTLVFPKLAQVATSDCQTNLNIIEEATKQLRTAFKVKLLQYAWQWAPEQMEGACDVEWSYADNTFEIYIIREEGYPVSRTPDVIIEF